MWDSADGGHKDYDPLGYDAVWFGRQVCNVRQPHIPTDRHPKWQTYSTIQSAYKSSEDFAKPYFHKYWTEIHAVTTIWKRNVCSFIVTLNAFDVRPSCDTADVQAILPFPPNPLKHILCDVSHVGRTSNAFKVTRKLQTFLFQTVVTSCISVQYLRKYGFAKSSDNLYAPCICRECNMAKLNTVTATLKKNCLVIKRS